MTDPVPAPVVTTSSRDVSPLDSPMSDSSSDEQPRLSRPKMGSRKSSGSMIVSRDHRQSSVDDEEIDDGDVRAMSPRRSHDEVDRLGEKARQDLMEQARVLQTSLQAIVDRVEEVKTEHEKLEGGNKFLQSYVPGPRVRRYTRYANIC
jgi:short coiled-coil protein